MILRVLAIAVAFAAAWALWFGYDQLTVLRGTPFWDYRYIVYTALAFLGLSLLEWGLGVLKAKTQPPPEDH